MTLKEKIFKQEIQKPENNYNIAKCMRKAHYSTATTRAGTKYRQLRKITQDIYSEENKEKELRKIVKLEKQLIAEKEYTNLLRAKELRFKASQWVKDTVINEGAAKEIIINYGMKTPEVIDNKEVIPNIST